MDARYAPRCPVCRAPGTAVDPSSYARRKGLNLGFFRLCFILTRCESCRIAFSYPRPRFFLERLFGRAARKLPLQRSTDAGDITGLSLDHMELAVREQKTKPKKSLRIDLGESQDGFHIELSLNEKPEGESVAPSNAPPQLPDEMQEALRKISELSRQVEELTVIAKRSSFGRAFRWSKVKARTESASHKGEVPSGNRVP